MSERTTATARGTAAETRGEQGTDTDVELESLQRFDGEMASWRRSRRAAERPESVREVW